MSQNASQFRLFGFTINIIIEWSMGHSIFSMETISQIINDSIINSVIFPKTL